MKTFVSKEKDSPVGCVSPDLPIVMDRMISTPSDAGCAKISVLLRISVAARRILKKLKKRITKTLPYKDEIIEKKIGD